MTLSDIRTKKGMREEYLYLMGKTYLQECDQIRLEVIREFLGLENDEAPSEARERLVENKMCLIEGDLRGEKIRTKQKWMLRK